MDMDNLIAGYKWLRDGIASRLGVDDNESVVDWSYGMVRTTGREGTVVTIQRL